MTIQGGAYRPHQTEEVEASLQQPAPEVKLSQPPSRSAPAWAASRPSGEMARSYVTGRSREGAGSRPRGDADPGGEAKRPHPVAGLLTGLLAFLLFNVRNTET